MMSSITAPSGSSKYEYCEPPTLMSYTSLVDTASRNAAAFGPRASRTPMWLTSNSPAALRTAACSSPTEVYHTGISQPPNGTIRAPAALCVSYKPVRLRADGRRKDEG